MKILEFMTKHRVASRWILLCLSFLFVFGLSFFNIPIVILFLIYIALMFVSYVFVEVYPPVIVQQKLINRLIENCDPFPLLKSSEELLSYNLNPASKRNVLINYCVALRNTGDYEKVYENLKSIDLHSLNEKELPFKLIYFNNLADVCLLLNKHDESAYCLDKVFEIYDKMPDGNMKKSFMDTVELSRADRCFLSEEYEKCLDIVLNFTPKHKENEVQISFFLGKVYLKLNDVEKARERLNFVVSNGNKLYSVIEAKKLLEEI